MLNNRSLHTNSLPLTKRITFSFVILVLLLVVAEVSVRVWAYYFRTPYERYNTQLGRIELIPNTRVVTAHKKIIINSLGFVGPEFERRKPDGMYRIFALGDSCTFGSGWGKAAYPWMVQELLNAAYGKSKFEVINAGIEGYNSTMALERLKDEILQYDPDMVLIYIGWNDLMKMDPDASRSTTGQYTSLATLAEWSYLVKAYRKLIFYYLRPLLFKPAVVPNPADSDAYNTFIPKTFEKNLVRMVEILRKRRIEGLLVTLPTVLQPSMTQEEISRNHVFFPYFAGSYSVDRLLSLHRAYNEIIRLVGLRYDIPVVDLDAQFNAYRKKDGLFWDTMHPNRHGHGLIARSIFGVLRRILIHGKAMRGG